MKVNSQTQIGSSLHFSLYFLDINTSPSKQTEPAWTLPECNKFFHANDIRLCCPLSWLIRTPTDFVTISVWNLINKFLFTFAAAAAPPPDPNGDCKTSLPLKMEAREMKSKSALTVFDIGAQNETSAGVVAAVCSGHAKCYCCGWMLLLLLL